VDAEQQDALTKIRRFYDSVYYGRIAERRPVSSHLRRLARRIGITQGMRLLDSSSPFSPPLRGAGRMDRSSPPNRRKRFTFGSIHRARSRVRLRMCGGFGVWPSS
jgi:hypothetical protein